MAARLSAARSLRGAAVAARRPRRAIMGATASRTVFNGVFGMGPKESKVSTKTLSDFSAKSIDGEEVPLSKYAGKVVLMVNVASA